MKTKETSLEELFVQTAGEMAASFSINRAVAQLYALLYIRPDPVSLEDMARRLRISKGSASVNIRVLEEWNAVKKVWVQGSRKDYYTAEPDFLKIAAQRLEKGLSRRLSSTNDRINRMNEIAAGKENNGQEKDLKLFYNSRLKQVREAQELFDILLKLLPKIGGLRKLKSLGSFL